MRYKLAEMVDEKTAKIIKGMSFKKFENACKIAVRLAGIHKTTSYLVIDTETNEQYKIDIQL